MKREAIERCSQRVPIPVGRAPGTGGFRPGTRPLERHPEALQTRGLAMGHYGLEGFLEGRPIDPVSDMLADLLAKGEVTPSAARAIQKVHKNELERRPHAKEG